MKRILITSVVTISLLFSNGQLIGQGMKGKLGISVGSGFSLPMGGFASKGGVVQLTKALAVEFGKYNIMVNAVSPGLTMTELIKSAVKDRPDFIEGTDRIPLRRAAEPEDIANVVLFLASSESDYITGQVIIVDGGLMAIHPRMVNPTD